MKKTIYLYLCLNLYLGIAHAQVPVYLYFASHNETNDQTFHGLDYNNAANYATMRSIVKQVCDTIIRYNARYEMMLESNFILGCLQNENAATNPNDIIQWANQQPQIKIQPHNHFKATPPNANPYNYADLVYLLDSCGVDTAYAMGGFIWRNFTTPTAVNEDWTAWTTPKAGFSFPQFVWKPTVLWGGGSPNHIDDYNAYGLWRPKAATATDFGTHDTTKSLLNFGNGCNDYFMLWDTTNPTLLAYRIMNFADSVNAKYRSTPNAFFNMKVMMNFRSFTSPGYAAKLGEVLRIIQPYIASGKIQYKGIMEILALWRTQHPYKADYFAARCENTVTISEKKPVILTATADVETGKTHFKVYPNPVQSAITIQFDNTKENIAASIKLISLYGQVIERQVFFDSQNQTANMNLSDLPNGIYFLAIDGRIQKVLKCF